jgi:hypothetical protein
MRAPASTEYPWISTIRRARSQKSQRNWMNWSKVRRNPRSPLLLDAAQIMPTDHSLPSLRRSASQAGRRRFDSGRPFSSNRAVDHVFLWSTRNRADRRPVSQTGRPRRQEQSERRAGDRRSCGRSTRKRADGGISQRLALAAVIARAKRVFEAMRPAHPGRRAADCTSRREKSQRGLASQSRPRHVGALCAR